jgi:hypothetical protein
MKPLLDLIEELEKDRSIDDPERLRERVDALDRLEVLLIGSAATELLSRATELQNHLEAVNATLYGTIRSEIQRDGSARRLLSWSAAAPPSSGQGYDYLDELVSGVLQFDPPGTQAASLAVEMVFYQPTPARHIFDLIRRGPVSERDVLFDLGSGLGHVSLLATLCAGVRSVGIELEPAYVRCARQCAHALGLSGVTFLQQDVREADLSAGTVFFLYTPFTGSILRDVLSLLRDEASTRVICVCTFGPCTVTVAREAWLDAVGPVEPGRIAVFRSRGAAA